MDYFNNIPNYYNNMYYDNSFRNTRQPIKVADRFIPGGFILPFALGFATAPLVLPRPRPYYQPYPPYPPYQPYQPYYYNYPIYK